PLAALSPLRSLPSPRLLSAAPHLCAAPGLRRSPPPRRPRHFPPLPVAPSVTSYEDGVGEEGDAVDKSAVAVA
ncbi:unnamed protein product, partial [Urochloa humidicola]